VTGVTAPPTMLNKHQRQITQSFLYQQFKKSVKMNKMSILLPALIFSLFVSCKHDEQINYPNEPTIEFKNIKIVPGFFDLLGNPGDSLELSFHYTEGDSKIGTPSLPDTTIYNCQIVFYKIKQMVFSLIDSNAYFSNPKYSSIPETFEPNKTYKRREVTVTTKSLSEGDLQINIFLFGYYNPFNLGDTLKASVQITDNAGNKSNIVEMQKIYSH
jgi:hypothetical protein